MNNSEEKNILINESDFINYIQEKIQSLSKEISEIDADKTIDCITIFSESDENYNNLNKLLKTNEIIVDEMSSGNLYKLFHGINTSYGILNFIKIRKYEDSYVKYGISVDFLVSDYDSYKASLNNPMIKKYDTFELIQFKTEKSIINVVSLSANEEYKNIESSLINIEKVKKNISKLNVNIDSIFIEENNNLTKYFYKDEYLHELRSCSKLLVAMAVGIVIENKILVNNELFTLDTKVFPLIEKYVTVTNKNNIDKLNKWTVRNLLTHTTGYEKQMFSEKFIKDIDSKHVLDYAINYDIKYEIGSRYAYNNVEPFIFSVIFKECLGIGLNEFINEYIFKKLNISEYEWKAYDKYCMAATGLYMKHTDFHKIASLLLNDGKYNDEQIISKHWIDEMIKLQIETPDNYKPERVLPKIGGGYFTFISRDGYVFRDGTNGQYIILNKDKNLLITIMASEENMQLVTEVLRELI